MIDNHEEREIHNTTTGDRPKPPKKAYQPPVLHTLNALQVKGGKDASWTREITTGSGGRLNPS